MIKKISETSAKTAYFSTGFIEMLENIDGVKFDNFCCAIAGLENIATVICNPYFAGTLENAVNAVSAVTGVLLGFGFTAIATAENVLECTNSDGAKVTVYLPDLTTFNRRDADYKKYYREHFTDFMHEFFRECYNK